MAKYLTTLGTILFAAVPALGLGHPLDAQVSNVQHAAEHFVLLALAGVFLSGLIYVVRARRKG